MIDVARALPEDPDELRAFTQLLRKRPVCLH